MAPERKAFVLVWDADEYLYPAAVFQSEQDAEAALEALVERLLEKATEEPREIDAGDLPYDLDRIRDHFRDHLSIETYWKELPLFLTDEYGESERDAARVYAALEEYLEIEDELDAARYP